MSPSTARDENPLIDSHEERLKSLEGHRSEVAGQLAAQTVQLGFLSDTIEKGLADLGERLEQFAAPIAKQVSDVVSTVDGLQKAESVRSGRRQERTALVKKIVGGLSVAAAGILGKEGAMWIWHHII